MSEVGERMHQWADELEQEIKELDATEKQAQLEFDFLDHQMGIMELAFKNSGSEFLSKVKAKFNNISLEELDKKTEQLRQISNEIKFKKTVNRQIIDTIRNKYPKLDDIGMEINVRL